MLIGGVLALVVFWDEVLASTPVEMARDHLFGPKDIVIGPPKDVKHRVRRHQAFQGRETIFSEFLVYSVNSNFESIH